MLPRNSSSWGLPALLSHGFLHVCDPLGVNRVACRGMGERCLLDRGHHIGGYTPLTVSCPQVKGGDLRALPPSRRNVNQLVLCCPVKVATAPLSSCCVMSRRHISEQVSPASVSSITFVFSSIMFPELWGWWGGCDADILIRNTQLQVFYLFHCCFLSHCFFAKQSSIMIYTRYT